MPPSASSPGSLIGRVIAGKLQLEQLLGSGSMGQVYAAHHRGLDKRVAIKVMRTEMHPTPEQTARFRAEAQAASRLDHRNTVRILDFGEDEDGLLYIAMEYLDGEELTKTLLRDGPLDPGRAAFVMLQVCGALSHAHEEGIVHRDIKPGNIMLVTKKGDEGMIHDFVKVCDFGIAKLIAKDDVDDVAPLTITGVALGTPAYASPEQIMGEKLDGRSDIYSCGVVLYHMLAGQQPFKGDSAVAMAMAHLSATPPPLLGLRPELDPELVAVVERAMAKRPDERFADAREMRAALKPFLVAEGEEREILETFPPGGSPSRPELRAYRAGGSSGALPVRPSSGGSRSAPSRPSSELTSAPIPHEPSFDDVASVLPTHAEPQSGRGAGRALLVLVLAALAAAATFYALTVLRSG
jgi:serine/threonine protein kinase